LRRADPKQLIGWANDPPGAANAHALIGTDDATRVLRQRQRAASSEPHASSVGRGIHLHSSKSTARHFNQVQASALRPDSIESMADGDGPGVQSITQAGFKISARKLPILRAGPIEEMTKRLGIAPPEMIFGDNYVRIEHVKSGWAIGFDAFDALDRVDKTGNSMLQVSYSREWQKNRFATSAPCSTACS
jgi:TIP41-like family